MWTRFEIERGLRLVRNYRTRRQEQGVISKMFWRAGLHRDDAEPVRFKERTIPNRVFT